MFKQCVRVADSYWLHMRSSLIGGVYCVIGVVLMIVMCWKGGMAIMRMPGIGMMSIVFLGTPMWAHLREQLVSDRSRHWPGYVGPHVVVFAIMALILIVVFPLVLIQQAGVGSLGFMALAGMFFAYCGWWVLELSLGPTVLGMAGWFWMFSTMPFQPATDLCMGKYEHLAMVMLLLNGVAIIAVLLRMCRLTEEDAAYHRRLSFNTLSLRPRSTGDAGRAWMQAQSGAIFKSWLLPSEVRVSSGQGWLERSRRWRQPSAKFSLRAVGFFALFAWTSWVSRFANSPSAIPPLTMFYLFSGPTLFVIPMWVQRWRFIENAVLWPVRRERFFSEIGVSIAVEMAMTWLTLVASFCLLLLCVSSESLAKESTWIMIACSLLTQVFGFGLGVWFLRSRSIFTLGAVNFIVAIPMILVMVLIERRSDLLFYAMPLTAACALAAVLVARNAYRRWLVTEMG